MKVHLAGPPTGSTPVPWCGTPRAAADLTITSKWDDVTCGRCLKEVQRRQRGARRLDAAERAARQGTLDAVDGELIALASHPALGAKVVSLDEYRKAKAGRNDPCS